MQGLREISGINREGVSLLDISEAAEKIGFRTNGIRIGLSDLGEIDMPCILHWKKNHFVILYKIKTNPFSNKRVYFVAESVKYLIKHTEEQFRVDWVSTKREGYPEGVILGIKPSPDFYIYDGDPQKGISISNFKHFNISAENQSAVTRIKFVI